jgi:putative membrane protein
MLTTATMRIRKDFRNNALLKTLVAVYAATWVITAIDPVFPADWVLENILVALFVPVIVVSYRRFPLSEVSYLAITLFMIGHAVGAHYTYAEVPLGYWARDAFGLARNHYDRLVHFSFGLLLGYPIREIFLRLVRARGFWAYYFPLDVTLAFSAVYEIIEMVVAKVVSPGAGDAYLGTQGDPFDGIMDMAMAFAGSVVCMVAVAVARKVTGKGPYLLADEEPVTGGASTRS